MGESILALPPDSPIGWLSYIIIALLFVGLLVEIFCWLVYGGKDLKCKTCNTWKPYSKMQSFTTCTKCAKK